MRTTVFMNLKGGTGKTVSAINAAAIFARDYAERVLLVDADSQCNMTEFVTDSTMPDDVTPGGFSDLLKGMTAFPIPTQIRNCDLLHADTALMSLDVSAAGSGQADPLALREYLRTVSDKYDRCIIDCPPAFSAGAMAALIAADDVVIPIKLDAFGIRGVRNLMEQIRNFQRTNRGLEIAGVLPTMYYRDAEQDQAELDLKNILASVGIRVFPHIRRSTKVDGMTFAQRPIIVSSPKSAAAQDYKRFVLELSKRGGADNV